MRDKIVIFTDEFDISSQKVIEYLNYLGEKSVRINIKDIINSDFEIEIDQSKIISEIRIHNETITLDNVKSIWFRRGGFYFKPFNERDIKRNKKYIKPGIVDHLRNERETLSTFYYESIINSKIRVLGNPNCYNTKKLSVLSNAAKFGLLIPPTIITNKKLSVIPFYKQHGPLITKAIQDNITIFTSDEIYGTFTEEIDEDILNGLADEFLPSLFQKKIEKKFEIRSFFLDQEFFSIAMFSQDSESTKVDFRNSNLAKPNRKSAYKLPLEIETKLRILLKSLELNTASVDLIYDMNDNHIFLEINPVGQYDMVGKLMNFQLDKKIAKWLAKN